jgi:Protein of unknown function (DUF2911)
MLTAVSPILTRAVAQAQERVSPHETVSVDLSGNKITIMYGRPYLKGRHVGEQVAPYNEVWRLGADEATKITVTARTKIGDSLELAPGSYSLFAIPQRDKWTIIVDKVADQWGAFKYDQSQDLGRFDVKVTPPSSPVEQFTISLAKEGSSTAALTFAWGKASVSTTLKTG